MAIDGARQLAQGHRPAMRDLLLTPRNASSFADQLARMRGAALKIGQLLSMDTGELLPPELAEILARLRADADYMPAHQLKAVLNANWGENWLRHFKSFDVRPIAAASIGQVHRAKTRDGRDLAIKVQYPGVRRSIDSDVDNVAALVRLAGLIPSGTDIDPLLAEAKRQLHEEADYEREAEQLRRFGALLSDASEFAVPTVHENFLTRDVLAMSYLDGEPIEALVDAPQEERDMIMRRLIDLIFREIFEFRLVQTDPNFANYRYDRENLRMILLDFGATREIDAGMSEQYRQLLRAGVSGDSCAIHAAARELGHIDDQVSQHHQDLIIEMMTTVFEAIRHDVVVEMSNCHMAARLRDAGMAIAVEQDFTHIPPPDTLYLHRKLGGIYLLGSRLKARVNVRRLIDNHV